MEYEGQRAKGASIRGLKVMIYRTYEGLWPDQAGEVERIALDRSQ